MMFVKNLVFTIIVALSFISCGSSSNNSNNENTTITGTFVDDPVEGLTYTCSSGTSGTTNANGEYNCPNGDDVTFSLGSLILGTIKAQEDMITPYSLFPNNATAALNLARILQSIGDTTNGTLSLNMELVEQLTSNIDFRSENFEEEVQTLLDITLVSASQARETLNESISSRGGEVPLVGIDGEDGEQGIQGEQGEQGEQGPAGEDGIDGEDGEQGPAGQDGADGVDGQDGVQGTQGEDGEDGANGEQGVQGDVGVDGKNALVTFTPINHGDSRCFFGGVLILSGLDIDNNGTLESLEVSNTEYICSGDGPPDNVAPSVIEYTPEITKSIMDYIISVTFSEGINTNTLNISSLFLESPLGVIDGTLSYDAESYSVTFSPLSQLDTGVVYTVRATTQIQDTFGNTLLNEHNHSFTLEKMPNIKQLPEDGFPSSSTQLGWDVAISNDGKRAVVGALSEQALYFYQKDGAIWSMEKKFTSSEYDFGYSVAISADGNTAVATSYNSQLASIYVRNSDEWIFQTSVSASDGDEYDRFGESVSLSADGNILVVGANGDSDNGTLNGSAYIFVRNGTSWSEHQKLYHTFTNSQSWMSFGKSVAISDNGNIIAIGEYDGYTINFNDRNGAVVVFERFGSLWVQKAELYAPNNNSYERFGWSVDLSGDGNKLIIGAPMSYVGDPGKGAAYLFEKVTNTTNWLWEKTFSDPDGEVITADLGDRFGYDVAFSGDGNSLIVGAQYDNTYMGSVFIYIQNGGVWSQYRKIDAPYIESSGSAAFGQSVDLSEHGYSAIIGTPWCGCGAIYAGGGVYVIE